MVRKLPQAQPPPKPCRWSHTSFALSYAAITNNNSKIKKMHYSAITKCYTLKYIIGQFWCPEHFLYKNWWIHCDIYFSITLIWVFSSPLSPASFQNYCLEQGNLKISRNDFKFNLFWLKRFLHIDIKPFILECYIWNKSIPIETRLLSQYIETEYSIQCYKEIWYSRVELPLSRTLCPGKDKENRINYNKPGHSWV